MSIEDNSANHDKHVEHDHKHPHKPGRRPARHLAAFGIAAFAILAIGAAGGAGAMRLTRPNIEMAPMTPIAISAMTGSSLTTVKGKVAEIFGNKFIVQDESGRALVETGPAGDGAKLVDANEMVSVQGRFENGFLHASFIVHQDGRTEALGPAGGPRRHGPLDELMKHVKP